MRDTTLDRVRAENERLEQADYPCDTSEQATGFYDALNRIMDFLNTLEAEQPSLPEGLDEAANAYENNLGHYGCVSRWPRDAFKAGAEWMARQGITKDGLVATYDNGRLRVYTTILDNEDGIKFGDKVIVQIRKK